LNEIYQFSKGTPRLINLLSDRALLAGFVDQTYQIEGEIIQKAKKSLLGMEENSRPVSFGFVSRFFRRVFP
jgi:general secretion pathway protein A